METYVHGVSTSKVDGPVRALGAEIGISNSEVSRICADVDERVAAPGADFLVRRVNLIRIARA